MNRQIAARIAGFTLLFYIAVGMSAMAGLFQGAAREAATLAQSLSAIVLALTFYVVTRVQGKSLAAMGMVFRLGEGMLPAIVTAAGIVLARQTLIAATLFSIGSLFFCWLLLHGRMMPRVLALLGVVASVVLVIALPLQIAGLLRPPLTLLVWMPMLAFEVPGGLWLMAKGVPRTAS